MADLATPPPLTPADIFPADVQAEPSRKQPSVFSRLLRKLDDAGNAYRITSWVILRFMGLVYFTAFMVAANQIIPLIGSDGLLPVDLFAERVQGRFGSPWECFKELPSIFWWNHSDGFIQAMMWLGAGLSFVVMCGYANALMLFVLWALYMSLVHVAQDWCGYGWDIQILETGFLAMLLSPLLDPRPFPPRAPPVLIIWLFRWLIFRIMLGAGLIKIRGDECWSLKELSALFYHYETQPVPNPLSRLLHFMPVWFHKFGVLWNHFVELAAPPFAFASRPLVRHIAGFLMASFMVVLIFSGNLSFLNWLTIIPCLACFDDSFWKRVLPRFITRRAEAAASRNARPAAARIMVSIFYTIIVIVLSLLGPVPNLISSRQAMNTSFDPLHLVGSYGAFGTIGRQRYEIIFEGTDDLVPDETAAWREYEFKVKPGDPMRRPAIITPYHHRLDWQMWFAAMASPNEYPWTIHLLWKFLHNDPAALSLIAKNPFPDKPPRHVRAVLYRYQFAPPGNEAGAWWVRQRQPGYWLKPFSKDDKQLRLILRQFGWIKDKLP